MRRLTDKRLPWWETTARFWSKGDGRAVLIQLDGRDIHFRLKGERTEYSLRIGDAYLMAVQAAVEAAKRRVRA